MFVYHLITHNLSKLSPPYRDMFAHRHLNPIGMTLNLLFQVIQRFPNVRKTIDLFPDLGNMVVLMTPLFGMTRPATIRNYFSGGNSPLPLVGTLPIERAQLSALTIEDTVVTIFLALTEVTRAWKAMMGGSVYGPVYRWSFQRWFLLQRGLGCFATHEDSCMLGNLYGVLNILICHSLSELCSCSYVFYYYNFRGWSTPPPPWGQKCHRAALPRRPTRAREEASSSSRAALLPSSPSSSTRVHLNPLTAEIGFLLQPASLPAIALAWVRLGSVV